MGPKALFRWTYSREEHYVQLLLDAMKEGQRVENGWKPQTDIIASFKTNGFGVVDPPARATPRPALATPPKLWALYGGSAPKL
jgi:hypothetical protein